MMRTLTIILLLIVLMGLLILLVDRKPSVAERDYSVALRDTMDRMTQLPETGTASYGEVFNRFKYLWSDLTTERIDELMSSVYADDVWFNDTVKTITDRESLRHYLHETAERVASCKVQVDDIGVSSGNYYVRWRMTVVPGETPESKTWQSIGVTHLRFNAAGQIIMHQDYWDSAGGLYEHLPVVGWMIRNIKARL